MGGFVTSGLAAGFQGGIPGLCQSCQKFTDGKGYKQEEQTRARVGPKKTRRQKIVECTDGSTGSKSTTTSSVTSDSEDGQSISSGVDRGEQRAKCAPLNRQEGRKQGRARPKQQDISDTSTDTSGRKGKLQEEKFLVGSNDSAEVQQLEARNLREYFTADFTETVRLRRRTSTMEARPPYTFQSGAIYSGWWKGNQRWGFGRQVWADGTTYEGNWAKNVPEGRGRLLLADGGEFIGEWQQGCVQGLGVFTSSDKELRYEGSWRNHTQAGFGVETWGPDENSYSGQFLGGMKGGTGVLTLASGASYVGDWKANKCHGTGVYKHPLGASNYKGEWKNGKMDGFGVYSFDTGRKYTGGYKSGLKVYMCDIMSETR